MITVTSVEAQNRFGQLLDMARREPVTVTRHGLPAAFIVSPQDMEELLDVRARRSKAVQAVSKRLERTRQAAGHPGGRGAVGRRDQPAGA